MSGWWASIVARLDAREVGTSVGISRVLIGACLVRTVLAVWWAGAMPLVWYGEADGGYRDLGAGPALVRLLGGPSVELTNTLFGLTVLGGALISLGVGGEVVSRLIAFGTLQVFTGLVDLNTQGGGSFDELLENMLWLLVLQGPTRTLSLDCRLRTGRWTSQEQVLAFPRYLMVYQAVLMCTTTGWQKVSTHWVPGGDLGALYYILQQPTWQRRDLSFLAWLYPLIQLMTLVTWLWEVFAPVWLFAFANSLGAWPRWSWLTTLRVRWIYMALGMTFHVLIAATLDVGSFSWASLCLYPAFIHPWEWRGSGDR